MCSNQFDFLARRRPFCCAQLLTRVYYMMPLSCFHRFGAREVPTASDYRSLRPTCTRVTSASFSVPSSESYVLHHCVHGYMEDSIPFGPARNCLRSELAHFRVSDSSHAGTATYRTIFLYVITAALDGPDHIVNLFLHDPYRDFLS